MIYAEPNEVLINVNESIISEQQNISESSNSTKKTIHYPAPTIVTQPARYQRTRMFSDLTSRRFCPLLQGGEDAAQQTYVTIRVIRFDFCLKRKDFLLSGTM